MTNQEWLQQNNAKIEEIKQLLEDKVVIASGEPKVVDIELPGKFATASSIYTYRVNRNTVLFASNVAYSGVWRYSAKDKSLKQLWYGGSDWSGFYSITDNLVIISTTTGPNPLLVYDIDADEITDTGIYYTASSMNIKKIDDNRFFISTTSSISKGLAVFDVRTKKARQIHSTSYNYSYFAQMGDYWFIASSTSSDGLLKFNSLTEEIVKVYDNGLWTDIKAIDDKCYFSSSSATYKGLYMYDNTNDTVTTLEADNYYWKHIHKIGDKIYVSNQQSKITGLYIIENNQLVEVYAENYGYVYAHIINDKAIFSGYNGGALILDITNETFTKIYNANFVNMGNSVVIGNKMLLTPASTNTSKLFIYNYDTNTLTLCSGKISFSSYNIFTLDGENCYISTTTLNKPIVYYTNADDSVKVVGYRMEV